MHKSDIVSICSFIVALGAGITAGSPLADSLDAATFGHGKYALSILTLLAFAAGCILRVLANPTPTPTDTKGS